MNLHNTMHRKIDSIIRTRLICLNSFLAIAMVKLIDFCLTWNVWCAAVSPVTQHGLSEVAGDMWWYVGWVKVCKVKWFQSLNGMFMHNGRRVFLQMSDSEVACCFAPLFYSSGDHAACRFRRVVEPCAAESNFRAFWPWAAWSKHAASQRNATSNVQACRICLVSSSEFGRMWSAFLWVWSQQPGEIVRRNHDL